jgi:hypothetical protein
MIPTDFALGFASYRRMLASAKDDAVKIKIVEDCAYQSAKAWIGIGGLERPDAVDEIHEMAVVAGLGDTLGSDRLVAVIGAALQRGEEERELVPADVTEDPLKNGHDKSNQQQQRPNRATVYVFPDPAMIPPRSCMYGQHYFRGSVTATVAPGGTGKTTLSLFEAITMAASGLRVWYVSGEDPRVEIDRRIAAHMKHHNIDPLTIAGNLFVDDKQSFPLRFTTPGGNSRNVTFDHDWIDAFAHAIDVDRIDVIIIDPLIGFLGTSENDNQVMDALVKLIADRICIPLNCCLEMSHHVRKPSLTQAEITVDDARGGGALVNATRSCRVINRMSSELAERAGVEKDKRTSYLRLDPGKRNMAPAEAASWWHLVSVLIGNEADNVQAIERWTYPGAMGGVTLADLDFVTELVRRPESAWRADARSPLWLGVPLAQRLGIDMSVDGDGNARVANPKKDCPKLNAILGTWVKSGALAIVERHDAKARKDFKFYVSPDAPETKTDVPGSQDSDGQDEMEL